MPRWAELFWKNRNTTYAYSYRICEIRKKILKKRRTEGVMRRALRDRFSEEWFSKEGVCASVLGVDGAVNWLLKQKHAATTTEEDEGELGKVNELLSLTPFDYCLRIAANVIPNPISQTMQKHFFRGGGASELQEFFVAHLPRTDELDWQDESCVSVMAGADRVKDGLPGHVLIVPKNGWKHWKFRNITLFIFHARKCGEEKVAIKFLERLRESCVRYAFNRGWTRIGIYFRPWGNDNSNIMNKNEGIEKIMRAHVVNLGRAGPGLSNTRWKNLTLDDAIEVLGGARKVASGRAIDVKREHRKSEILLDVDHRLEEIEEIEARASSVPLSKMDREVNTQIRQLRSTQTQVSEKEEEESNTNSVQVEDATMFFESSEGKSYVNLSNDAERKALELLSLY